MSHSWRLVLKRFFGRLVSRRLSRRTFQELSRSLALIVDQEPLAASIAARIRELVDPERLIILIPDEGKASFPLSASLTGWTEVRIADDGPGIPPDQGSPATRSTRRSRRSRRLAAAGVNATYGRGRPKNKT